MNELLAPHDLRQALREPASLAFMLDQITRALDELRNGQAELLAKIAAAPAPALTKATYSPAEFSRLVGRSARWVQQRARAGLIPVVPRSGRNILIPASALAKFATGRARIE